MIRQKLADDYPAVAQFRSKLADSRLNIGIRLAERGESSKAEAEFRRALALYQKLAEENPTGTEYRTREGACHDELGRLLVNMGNPSAAEAEFRTCLDRYKKLVDENPTIPAYLGGGARTSSLMASPTCSARWETGRGSRRLRASDHDPRVAGRKRTRGRDPPSELGFQPPPPRNGSPQHGRPGRRRGRRPPELELYERLACGRAESGSRLLVAMPAGGRAGRTRRRGGPAADAGPHLAKAVALLARAIEMGYRNPDVYRTESDLDPLRHREAFQKLLQKVGNSSPAKTEKKP